jgi:RNA polymerase sigma-70 factor (ECF subfamily)
MVTTVKPDRDSQHTVRQYDLSDLALYARILAGDQGGVEDLIKAHASRIQVIIYRIIEGYGDFKEAEELTNQVFFRVWCDIKRYNPERGSFRTWTNMLAKYTALDFCRKERKRLSHLEPLKEIEEAISDSSIDELVEQIIQDKDGKEKLLAALKQIPEETRDLVTRHHFDGKSYNEISREADIPVGTVKSRISRGIKQIKLLIIQDFHFGDT